MSNLNYIPLHGHSAYSIGDGVAKIEDIVKRAIEINSPAIALTEHGNMCSFLKFYKECKKNNIKPIMGCELYVNESFYANRDKFLELQKSKKTKKQKKGEKVEEDTVEVVETESTDETDKKVDEDSVDLDESTVDDDSALGDINDKNSHVVVYAKNLQGLKNIIQLSNIASNNFYKKPLVSHELILTHLDSNNIVTTACMASDWNKFTLNKQYNESVALYKRYKERFGDDFYAEIHLNEIPEQKTLNLDIIKICNKLNINTLFSLDYHYVYKDDWYIQYLLYVVKSKHTVETMTPDDWFYNTRTLYIKTYDEVIEEFKKYEPEYFESLKMSLNNTLELNEKIENFEIPFYQNNYPKFLENYEDSCKLFKEKIIEGFKKKLLNGLIPEEKQQIYLERVRKEFDIIKSKGHVDYFLIYEDVVNNFVKNSGGNLGCGRGSAAGSFILFLLDVTKVDSIRFNLLFERFLNPQRKDPPDIDTDCDSETRKNIEIYLKQKYGEDKVCHISNFTTFGPKTIVKDLARVFKLDYMKSNKLTGTFSATGEKSISEELDNARQIFEKLGKKDMVKFVDDSYEIFTKYGPKFVDNPRQVGKHASGILISNKELIKSDIPTMCLKGEIVTALQEGVEVKEVGELGYVKLDILGLTTVSIIKDAIKQIENTKNVKNIENMIIKSKMDDKKVYEQFKLGETKDIFQFGSEQMIALMKNISPDSIEDLSAGNALFRPACIESGMIQEYLDNKKDIDIAKVKYDKISPLIWKTLENTYGTILYQEQIMFILQNVGGFTLAEADSARKIMKVAKSGESDKKFADLLEKFKHSAVKNGLKEADAIDLIDKMVNYLKYSFNMCLSEGTFIETGFGSKNIKDFKSGDNVISYDFETKKTYVSKVKELHNNGEKNVYRFHFENEDFVECTLDHKFMTRSGLMKTVSDIIKDNDDIVFKKSQIKKCVNCGKAFIDNTANGIKSTCSIKCRNYIRNEKVNNSQETKICIVCSKEFKSKNKSYCSRKCRFDDSYFKGSVPWNKKTDSDSDEKLEKMKQVSERANKTKRMLYDKGEIVVWNKGLTKDCNESLKRLSESRIGKNNPIHSVINDSEKYELWCKNISNSLTGKIRGNMETYYGEESAKNIKLKQSNSAKKREIHGHTGIKHSEESKDKMREATAKRISSGKMKHTNTKPMVEFENILDSIGVLDNFKKEHLERFYTIDYADVDKKVAIEIDGDFWHCNPNTKFKDAKYDCQKKNMVNDKRKNTYLTNRGWKVIRFFESDLKNVEQIKSIIKEIYNEN